MADHAGIGALAAQETQRIDQQRFAGPGFTGNDGHAGAEGQLGGTDNGEIGDGKAGQHRA